MVKAGLILGLFGGTQRSSDKIVGEHHLHDVVLWTNVAQNNLSIRGDPHILLVGDPGLGKSQVHRPFDLSLFF